jgi:tetratricopeptide (TPR) repeat protein
MKKKSAFQLFSLTAMILFLNHTVLFSQKVNTAGQEILDLIKTADDVKGKKNGAIIILKEYNSVYDGKQVSSLTIRVIGKIYDNKALDDYSHIPIAYNSFYDDVALVSARVIRKDNSVIEINKDAVQVKTSPDIEGDTKYSDTKFLTFALSGLEPGASFEYILQINHKKPVIDGEWFEQYYTGGMLQKISPPYIPRIDPVQKVILRLAFPKNLIIDYNITAINNEPEIQTKKDQRIYIWEIKDIPGITVESSMPVISSLNPVLSVTTLKSWAFVNKWARERLFTGFVITQRIKDKAEEITSGITSREEKIKAIANYVRKNVRYVYADIGRGGYTPHPLEEILDSRYGDCKDQSILFISLLNSIGIDAFPVLVNPFPQDELTAVPAPNFSHLITVIPGERDSLWLDMTSQVTPFPGLAFSDQHRKALVIDGISDRLILTPESPSFSTNAFFTNTVSFKKGVAISDLSIKASGAISEALKSLFISAGNDDMNEFFSRLVKNYIANARLDSVTLPGLQEQDASFSSHIYFHLDSAWEKGGATFAFESLSSLPLAFLAGLDSRSMPEKRENDIVFSFPYEIQSSEIYLPPQKFMFPISIPPDDSLRNEFLEFKRSFTRSKSDIVVSWKLKLGTADIKSNRYSSYVTAVKKMEEMASWNVTYVDPFAIVKNLQNVSPVSILNESEFILRTDPRNMFGLLLKGVTFDRMGMRDSSIRVYTKALSLEPENIYAHYWIAFPLFSKNMNKEALSHLDTAIKIDPSFIDAYSVIAAWYDKENQNEKALNYLKKSTEANPESVQAWINLAAYKSEKEKKPSESVKYIMTAMELDSTNADAFAVLSETYMKMNSYRKACEALEKAINLSPGDGVLYGNLAWAYYMMNNDVKCIEYSKKAVEIDPKLYFAKFNLALATLRSGNISEAYRLYNDLRKDRMNIPSKDIIGALSDLDDLVAKGIHTQEANNILKSFNGNPHIVVERAEK